MIDKQKIWSSLCLPKLQLDMTIFFTKGDIQRTIFVRLATIEAHILTERLEDKVALCD